MTLRQSKGAQERAIKDTTLRAAHGDKEDRMDAVRAAAKGEAVCLSCTFGPGELAVFYSLDDEGRDAMMALRLLHHPLEIVTDAGKVNADLYHFNTASGNAYDIDRLASR